MIFVLGTCRRACRVTIAHDQQILWPPAIWEIVRRTCQPRWASRVTSKTIIENIDYLRQCGKHLRALCHRHEKEHLTSVYCSMNLRDKQHNPAICTVAGYIVPPT